MADGQMADGQTEDFRRDVLAGLSAPIPAIPARWLYDHSGSELFDAITRLPTYYPTRTETALLKAVMPEIAARLPEQLAVVEFGAGSATKTPILLEAVTPSAYVPVDISGEYLEASAAALDADARASQRLPHPGERAGNVLEHDREVLHRPGRAVPAFTPAPAPAPAPARRSGDRCGWDRGAGARAGT